MLIREDEQGLLAIGQPSHAWLSGQLARAWGDQRFGDVHPRAEVCLAAGQHDVGWGEEDLEPVFDPESGRPVDFMSMPLAEHLEIFTRGPRRLLSQSSYAALLVSMHGRRLYERRDLARMSPPDAEAVRSFLEGERTFQTDLLERLRTDPCTAAAATEEVVQRNSMLVWTWDYLSLALCLGWSPATARRCPTVEGEIDVELELLERSLWRVTPWPFTRERVTVRCEGRRLGGRFETEHELREAFARARLETLELTLQPG